MDKRNVSGARTRRDVQHSSQKRAARHDQTAALHPAQTAARSAGRRNAGRRHGWQPRRRLDQPRNELTPYDEADIDAWWDYSYCDYDDDDDYGNGFADTLWEFVAPEYVPFADIEGLVHVTGLAGDRLSACLDVVFVTDTTSTDSVAAVANAQRTKYPLTTCLACVATQEWWRDAS